jgi:hypothetical protein
MNIFKQIYENNTDLLERLETKKLNAQYLKHEDVFLLQIGKTTSSYDSIDVDDLMTIHYDPDTLKITGFTISYVKEFVQNAKLMMKLKEEKEKELYSAPRPQSIASAGLFRLSFCI